MCCKGFIKRIIPFFLALAVGLFIASFFVSIAAPNFRFKLGRHQEYHRQLEFEKQRLKEENDRLKRELSDRDLQDSDNIDFELRNAVPPPPMVSAKIKAAPYRGR